MAVIPFSLVFSCGFAIRYPFPEIREEVPKNFERTEFFTPFVIWFSASSTKDDAASEVTGRRISNV